MTERTRFATTLVSEMLLGIGATMLVAAPWLRAFPASVAAAPLLGAAALSVMLPGFSRQRPLALCIAINAVGFVGFELLAVLRAPTGVDQLGDGLIHGPAQLLTFALPLVSPRTLLVDPVALTWLAGTVAGIAITRRWSATLPTLALLGAFGLAYAATQRAAGTDAVAIETWLAVGLLGSLLALRALQTWRDSATPAGRALSTSGGAALAVTLAAALLVQTAVFGKHATAPQRTPTVNNTTPLTPIAFVAGLRPTSSGDQGQAVFDVDLSAPTSGYLSLANVDSYDGAGWAFDRTFRPSGGVMPEADTATVGGREVTQTYRIISGPLTAGPWMPYLERPQRVSGVSINIDAASGMIVPSRRLGASAAYSVTSEAPLLTFDRLDPTAASPDTATPASDTQLPATLRSTLATIVSALSTETGVASTTPLAFLQALQRDFRDHYALVAPTRTGVQRAGGTGFSDVLASILGTQRTATPEQYATLTALVARELGVPARVVTGFRIPPASGDHVVQAGEHTVRTGEAWTWTEIAISGAGWIVLDAAPTTFRTPAGDQTSGAALSSTPSAAPSANTLITTGNGGNAVAKRSAVPHDGSTGGQVLLILTLAVVGAVLVTGFLVLALRKRVRAARRRRLSDPGERITAAWQEAIDRLYEAHLADPGDLDSLTSREISALARERFPSEVGDHAAAIGGAAESATFATAVLVHPDEAEESWRHERELRRALSRNLSLRERLAAIGRYHRTSHPRLRWRGRRH